MLKRQKVQDAIQVLSQPGLQAEEIDVEVSRLNTLGRLPEGVSLRGTETRVIKTPAHQAHLGEEQQGWISWQPHSKTQPVWSLHGSHLTQQERLVPCLAASPLQVLLPTWKNLYLRLRKTAPPDSPAGKEGARDGVTHGSTLVSRVCAGDPRASPREQRSGLLTSAGMLIAGHPAAQELVCHYLTDVCQAGEDVFAFGDGLDTVCPLQRGSRRKEDARRH